MAERTHKNIVVNADKKTKSAKLALQWFLEPDKTGKYQFPITTITTNNEIKIKICGQEGFNSIYEDILAARQSVDLICWGFDPGMPLIRSGGSWHKKSTYGELLKAKARSGVKIRLLVWYNPRASVKQQNLIGYSGTNILFPNSGPDLRSHQYSELTEDDMRQNYCIHWWNEVLSGLHPNLSVMCRDGESGAVKKSLNTHEDAPDASSNQYTATIDSEESLLEKYATHHQKPILIDYGVSDAQGDYGVGYIMGLNSISDFWDSKDHLFDSPLREPDWNGASHTALYQFKPATEYMGQNSLTPLSREPYQDYAARLRGGVLASVHTNFVQAWVKAHTMMPRKRYTHLVDDVMAMPAVNQPAQPFKANPSKPLQLQVLRTQPQENTDQSIKAAYRHIGDQAQTYLYVENQYFYYELWVRELLDSRKSFTAGVQRAGRSKEKHPILHLLVVMPWPEDKGMVPRTYATLHMLGTGDSMPGQQTYVRDHNDAISNETKFTSYHTAADQDGELHLIDPTAQNKLGQALGIKSLFCRLVTYNSQGIKGVRYWSDSNSNKEQIEQSQLNDQHVMYRQIYIHSKLLMADDVYFTLGSANLNQRSMAVDSEINVACASIEKTRDLRHRVWTLMTDGYKACVPDMTNQEEMAYSFGDWKDLANKNFDKMTAKTAPVSGFIVSFQDKRSSNYRHA